MYFITSLKSNEAAQKCFAQKGFHQTSMQDIVAESGLSPGAIYLYFRSKDEIIQATADIRHQNEKELFSEIFAGDNANHALRQIAHHLVNMVMNRRKCGYPGLDGLSILKILYALPFKRAYKILKKTFSTL